MSKKHKVATENMKIDPLDPFHSKFPPYTTTPGHFGAEMARTLIDPDIWESYEKIGFIRNPYGWVASFYNQPNTDGMFGEDNRTNLSEFIENLKLTPFSWFTDSNGEILIDNVYRLEDLSEVLDKYGCETVHIHKMPKWKDNVTADDVRKYKEIIKKKFRREFEYYD